METVVGSNPWCQWIKKFQDDNECIPVTTQFSNQRMLYILYCRDGGKLPMTNNAATQKNTCLILLKCLFSELANSAGFTTTHPGCQPAGIKKPLMSLFTPARDKEAGRKTDSLARD